MDIINSVSNDLSLTPLEEKDVLEYFNEKKISESTLKKRELLLGEVKDTSFVKMAKNNFFKGGRFFAFLRLVKRKVFKK